MNIRKIEVHKPIEQKKLRVAAYCRVSTDNTDQLESLETQKSHYLQKFITSQTDAITEFDESLVRHLLAKVTVFDQKLVFEFKSGVSVEIEN